MYNQEKKDPTKKEAPERRFFFKSDCINRKAYLIIAFNALPGLNFGTFFAAIVIF